MLHPLVYPMFAQVLLTLFVAILMFYVRLTAIKSGKVKFSYFKTFEGDAPDLVIKTSRHFSNLFEVPVLFFAAGAVAIALDVANTALFFFAWLFVIARVVHVFTHIFLSNIYPRMTSYLVGWIAVLGMWILLLT